MGLSIELRSGSELLGYRIERVLGRGGMGVVYLAYQLVLDRMVALKLLAPELAQDDRFRERFLRESKLAASLDHPHIVPVFDAGEVDGRLYISMRYVEGSDLRRILDDEAPLDPAHALALLAPIADALDAAHGRGLVHRDVKPSNILVDETRRPYLADFGLTKTMSEEGSVEQSHFAASLDYVAPEQIERDAVGPSADTYALGCVLYECLTGAPPFHAGSRMSVLWGHLNAPAPPATARNPSLPGAIDTVLAKALAKDPGERTGSARELVAEAERALGLTRSPRALTGKTALAAAGAALATLGTVAAVLAIALTRGSAEPPPVLAANSVAKLDAKTGELAAVVATGRDPGPLSGGQAWIWAVNTSDGTVSQIDRKTGAVERTVRIDGTVSADSPSVVAADGAIAWVVSGSGGKGFLTKVGESSGAFPPRIPLGVADPVAVAVGEGAVWVAGKDIGSNVILKVDPRAGRVVARTRVAPGETVTDLGAGEGGVWFTDWGNEETLTRLDPATMRATGHVDTPGDDALTVADGSVWLGDMETGFVTRIDPATMRIIKKAAIVHRGIFTRVDVAVGGGAVWFGNLEARQVFRLDPQSLAVTARIDIAPPDPTRGAYGAGPVGIVAGSDGAWVAVGH